MLLFEDFTKKPLPTDASACSLILGTGSVAPFAD